MGEITPEHPARGVARGHLSTLWLLRSSNDVRATRANTAFKDNMLDEESKTDDRCRTMPYMSFLKTPTKKVPILFAGTYWAPTAARKGPQQPRGGSGVGKRSGRP